MSEKGKGLWEQKVREIVSNNAEFLVSIATEKRSQDDSLG